MKEALISDPMLILAYLFTVLATVFALSTVTAFKRFFDFLPAVIWAYFIPMISTSVGIIPDTSPLYSWTSKYILPFALFLLMLTIDLKAVLKLGKTGLLVMVLASISVWIAGIMAYALFGAYLPPEAWKEFGALTGSWIGGNANMVAVGNSFEPVVDLSRIIVMDTVVGYGWLGILIWLSTYQMALNKHFKADTRVIDELNAHLAEADTEKKPIETLQIMYIVGIGMAVTIVVVALAQFMPKVGNPTLISASTWAILLLTTLGILLSLTPIRKIEISGASRFGYFALYFLLTTIGAQGDITKIFNTPLYLVAGIFWMVTHAGLLYLIGKIFKAPSFILATASMANIGAAASAPVVAVAYQPAMAPVGVLMSMLGYAYGTYLGLLGAWVMSQLQGWF
ncbi:MAG: DUF819 family protein [Bacteroidetes Order II. Incertae sedis bacterium]|nr:DUF819 family protein [Bacteroidetes Order II. bacterium]